MSIEWQMLFGSETPYWIVESESLVQPSPLEVVEDTTSNSASNCEQ